MEPIREAFLVTSGDLRQSANEVCWPAQAALEEHLVTLFARKGCTLRRAFPVDPERGHGFIASQREGMRIFASIPLKTPLVFATAAWQYTHHVLPGLRSHHGPILTVANWSGKWPGLVGLLNLNGSLVKAGVAYSTLWSERFDDPFAEAGVEQWLANGRIEHDQSHVRAVDPSTLPASAQMLGKSLAGEILRDKIILGVFDEGCMGMYNAIIDDEILNRSGFYKERLSQSALYAAMLQVKEEDASGVLDWLRQQRLHFNTGSDEATELTESQLLQQGKMYVAAVRLAAEFGCDAVGIQYQQGLKDLAPASDLVEGLLNNPYRPPVYSADSKTELFAGEALPHFNEVDECAGVDAVVTNRCWRALGLNPSTTLHDVRWGEQYRDAEMDDFVWLWQISGAAPASHFVGGYAGSSSDRQPAMYFPKGGGTLKGIGRPGDIVWSRVFVEDSVLHVDMGLAKVIVLPPEETSRRWNQVTREWPMVSVITPGISRNQFMARHRANHVSLAYAPSYEEAFQAFAVKAATFAALGIKVHQCGVV